MSTMRQRLAAELLGTFALVFAGTGAIVVNDVTGAVTHVGIALTFGLVVMALIYTLGDVSGAHFNPAVTIGFVLARRFPFREAWPYMLVQFLGALAASGTLRFLFPDNEKLGTTSPRGSWMQSFVLELLLSAFLMFVILNTTTGSKEKGLTVGIVVGAVIGLEAMFAGGVSGASMNPARSFAPALVSGHFESLWIYLLAPTLGACVAVPGCRLVQTPGCCVTAEGCS